MPLHIDTKYINLISPRLERFKWKKDSTLAVCRCPICGDSEKSKSLTRFYFYEKKGAFSVKCHNCDYGASLGWFIKGFDDSLYRQYTFEVLKESGARAHGRADAPAHGHPRPRTGEEGLLAFLPRLDCLPKDHPASEFAAKRRIPSEKLHRLYYAEDYGEWARRLDPDMKGGNDPRIVIPILDRAGKLVGAQGRIVGKPAGSSVRYLTVKVDKDSDKMWYGMDVVDPSLPVIVVEGPLDSLFLDNSVAMVGLSNALTVPEELKDSTLHYALDNEPRNRQVAGAMERIADSKHSICVWSDRVAGYKDINDMILSGMSRNAVQSEIVRNSHRGISAHIAIKRWAK